MTNTKLLKSKLVEKGFTIGELAETIGISHTSMSYKINGKRDFTVKEIYLICTELGIDNKDKYFLQNKNAYKNAF